MKKLAVIGKGTAGVFAVCHFLRYTDWEIDWYYDETIIPQAVGEATTLLPPKVLFQTVGFEYPDLVNIGGTVKTGLRKKYWGSLGKEYVHTFPPGSVGYHFSVVSLQSYMAEKLSKDPRVKIINRFATPDTVDSDYVMVCSGKPNDLTDFHISEYIPVNHAYVNQCYWPCARFTDSLHIARKYGWVFGIPLQERCSIGYVFNDTFATLDEVKKDMETVFEEFGLTPSEDTLELKFGNYYRKNNFQGRVAYNGNASFFLEPQESTSITTMDYTQRYAYDYWHGLYTQEETQARYENQLHEVENFLMLHYFSGSAHKNDFWEYAQKRGENCMHRALKDPKFLKYVDEARLALDNNWHNGLFQVGGTDNYGGVFWHGSFTQILKNTGVLEPLMELRNNINK
jgi:hypothetical protein